MRKSSHTPLPRYRAFAGPALLTQGFRPFFFAAGLWALAALALSFEMIHGRLSLPTVFDPITWHIHELIFGYAVAAIAGFLLTAIPNWTGRLPLQGWSLLALVALWLAGRLTVGASGLVGAALAAAVDAGFLVALAAVALREIVVGRNWRNLVPIAGVLTLFAANLLMHADAMGLTESGRAGRRLAIAVVIMLISLIGGRVVPSFTRNWLVKRGAQHLPAGFGAPDRLAMLGSLLALGVWTVVPEGPTIAVLMLVAAALQFWRLVRWRGWAAAPEPLLWVLHLGYLWIPLGFLLMSLSQWLPTLPATGALHALTVGAIGTMTLAVMSRAILGHTGRPLTAGAGLTTVYLLITLAAICRVGATVLDGIGDQLMVAAAVSWSASFIGFLMVCGPMLLGRAPQAAAGRPHEPEE